uniref:ATP synthase complex subunit 8 n=1 Tax=Astrotoma agassizii TaxID=462866 RepID=A0A3G2WHY5_9ECHI|nr:ATP synthase F0 subunit 8 [Astrotoma agassizii]AYO99597.1 ATP synthase F0 subunit 8 [Astrotoma agassizii]
MPQLEFSFWLTNLLINWSILSLIFISLNHSFSNNSTFESGSGNGNNNNNWTW